MKPGAAVPTANVRYTACGSTRVAAAVGKVSVVVSVGRKSTVYQSIKVNHKAFTPWVVARTSATASSAS